MNSKKVALIIPLFSISLVVARPKLTLSMCVRNEANRYLRTVLEDAAQYIDQAVIIDDASTDNTIEVVKECLKHVKLHLVQNEISKFSNEITLRQQQWNETIKTSPDWVLLLDADEVFENKFKSEVRKLIERTDIDVFCFRLYDFWDEDHYREDQFWCAHYAFSPFLFRYKKDIEYTWNLQPQHCGRGPKNIINLPKEDSPLRLKHLGWSKKTDRVAKFNRYMQLDPGAKYGWMEQYQSVLDPNPRLVKWVE